MRKWASDDLDPRGKVELTVRVAKHPYPFVWERNNGGHAEGSNPSVESPGDSGTDRGPRSFVTVSIHQYPRMSIDMAAIVLSQRRDGPGFLVFMSTRVPGYLLREPREIVASEFVRSFLKTLIGRAQRLRMIPTLVVLLLSSALHGDGPGTPSAPTDAALRE
ncbi:hypothetical protein Bbelb_341250 [Branchiostoma belcheri]|nr:hypothetical protein Bbelb_341250 [Branchiostoma belcheri]